MFLRVIYMLSEGILDKWEISFLHSVVTWTISVPSCSCLKDVENIRFLYSYCLLIIEKAFGSVEQNLTLKAVFQQDVSFHTSEYFKSL